MLSALSAFPIDSAAAITQSSNAVQALMTKPKLVSANGVVGHLHRLIMIPLIRLSSSY